MAMICCECADVVECRYSLVLHSCHEAMPNILAPFWDLSLSMP